jgi:hypothetical protein
MTHRLCSPLAIRIAFSLLLAAAGTTSNAQTNGVYILAPPEVRTNPDGNSVFGPFDFPGRFQQVYDASALSALSPGGGGWIRQILFRIDPSLGHPFIATAGSIQLNISTTHRSVDGLSQIFAENIGADETVLFGPSSIYLSGDSYGALFDFPNLPYYYSPANGNLLLDFRVNAGFPNPPQQGVAVIDAFNIPGDTVSSLYSSDVASPTGQASSVGLATYLIFFQVPEPTTFALLATALGVLALGWKGKRKG